MSLNPMKGSLASRRSQCYVKRNSSFSQQLFYYSYFRCTTVSVCHSNSSFCQQPVDPSVTAYIAPSYSGDPSTIHTATLSPNWGLTTPNQNVIANCSQTVPDTTVVCIDSLWDHTIALSNSTIVDRGTPSPKKGSQKLNSKLL